MFQQNQQIGPYTLIDLLGRGTFGEVWLAENPNDLLHSQVALKLPLDPNPDIAAIQKEAQIWQQVGHHPNVLPVIEAKIIDGQVMIASEYIEGGSLTDWLKQHGGKAPSIEAAVEMATGILNGLEHLHTLKPQPIVHRDLKPDNVLLQNGIPRLTDFGISRALTENAYTVHNAGTPLYMSPEALDGHYSSQSDTWAMGVLLYKMLTGSLPFSQFGARQDNFSPLPVTVPLGIQTVVAKALSKDPKRRFASAMAMREALLTAAQPMEHKISEEAETMPDAQPDRKGSSRKESRKRKPSWGWFALPLFLLVIIATAARLFWHPTKKPVPLAPAIPTFSLAVILAVHTGTVRSVAWSPDSKFIVTGSEDWTAQEWDIASGNERHAPMKHGGVVYSAAWSPDGRYIVTGSEDGTAKIWDAATGIPSLPLKDHTNWVHSVAWSPDGKAVVTGSKDTTRICSGLTEDMVRRMPEPTAPTAPISEIYSVAWSPDSKYIVTGGSDPKAKVWDPVNGSVVQTLLGHNGWVHSVAWSPDSKYIVTGGEDATAKIWNESNGNVERTLKGHANWVLSASWSPDSKYIATGSADNKVKIWDAATGNEVSTLLGHTDWVEMVAWSPDGKYLATGSKDKTVKIWKVSP